MSPARLLAVVLLASLLACHGGPATPNTPGPALPSTSLGESTVGAPFSRSLAASGGTAPLSYSAQGLPTGISLDPQGGTLSGSPSVPGSFEIAASVTDAAGRSDQRSYPLLVLEAPHFVTASLPPATATISYAVRVEASGGKAPLAYGLSGGAPPPGVAIDASGTLSGTPSAPGTYSFELSVTDAHGSVQRASFTLEVRRAPLIIATSELTSAYVAREYRFTFSASGGTPPYSWSQIAGELPSGLAFSTAGELSGTPALGGTFSFTLEVQDAEGQSAQKSFSLAVIPALAITTSGLPEAYRGSPYQAALAASGGVAPYTYSLTGGVLPSGLQLDNAGRFSGTPAVAGSFGLTLTVQDASQQSVSRAFTLTVLDPPSFASSTLGDGAVGVAYSHTFQATGGKPPFTFRVISGALPAGLQLSGNAITGTPTTPGTASFTAEVRDANGQTGTRSFTLAVYTLPTLTTTTLPEASQGQPYAQTLTVSGGKPGYSFIVESGSTPEGITLSSSGELSGTPTGSGSSFTVRVFDANSRSDARTFLLAVRASTPDGGPLFTLGQWNIEWFGSDTNGPPRSTSPGGTLDDLQIANARDLIGDAGVNLWGLVEMVDTADFQALKAQLPGYNGFLSNDPIVAFGSSYYGLTEQKVGVLYDSRLTFQSATLILTTDPNTVNDFAGRPPMRVDFTTSIQGTSTPLTLIVLHMKAFDDQVSYGRRQRAGAALKSYLDSVLPSSRVFVVGDWNDDVDVSITYDGGVPLPTPYENFVAAPSDYTFITRPLSLAGEGSTTGYPDMIDHTLASNELAANYVPNSVHVLRPTWIPDYDGTTSDHYPVLSQYAFEPAPPPPPPYRARANGAPF